MKLIISEGDAVILHTGWSRYKDDLEIYLNRLPRISVELARWLVERKVKLVAMPLKIAGGDGAPVRAIIIEE